MKALVKKSPEKGIWLEDVPVPPCSTNDVKIKITHTAICGTDLREKAIFPAVIVETAGRENDTYVIKQ